MNLDNKKILVVEDEAPLRLALEFKLKSAGFDVISAADGEDGLKKAKTEKPDLVLLDIILPKMDGFAVLDALSEDEQCKNLEVIILTNLSPSGEVLKHEECVRYEYLVKADWKLDDLIEKVKNKLANGNQAR